MCEGNKSIQGTEVRRERDKGTVVQIFKGHGMENAVTLCFFQGVFLCVVSQQVWSFSSDSPLASRCEYVDMFVSRYVAF